MILAVMLGLTALGCSDLGLPSDGPGLSRGRRAPLKPGEHLPEAGEEECSGRLEARLRRGEPGFDQLVSYRRAGVVFKDEEGSGADRLMTTELRGRLARLALLVQRRWSGVQLRVTEAWDEEGEHSGRSLHYGGRAADLTTSDLDRQKLGELAVLSRQAGFDWVYYEHSHVHASVRRSASKN